MRNGTVTNEKKGKQERRRLENEKKREMMGKKGGREKGCWGRKRRKVETPEGTS